MSLKKMTTPAFRIPRDMYEGNTKYLGNGLAKYCFKCAAHRPYLPGGTYFGPKGLKYWNCKLHTVPMREK